MNTELTPESIRENIENIGKKEALALLREIITANRSVNVRKRALNIFGEIDTQKNFKFLEQLFLSDEEIEARLIVGKILLEKYPSHKKTISLFEYVLKEQTNIEQQLFSINSLHLIDTVKSRKILIEYLRNLINFAFTDLKHRIPNEVHTYRINSPFPKSLVDICINLRLYNYYVKFCGFLSSLRAGKIVSLYCESLHLGSIKEIVGIEHLNELEHLSIHRTEIESIDNLSFFKNLKTLDLSKNNLSSIENLESVMNLEELDLSNNRIQKIENLKFLKNLKKLALNNNRITVIENLDSLRNLEDLNLSYNQIKRINNLEYLIKLKKLSLSNNRIEEITGLDQLSDLIMLYINDNNIAQIKGLETHNQLKVLYLSNNVINRLEGLNTLVNLKKLELSNNKISKLEAMENLTELQELYLDNNNIESLEGLDPLKKLIILHIGRNQITMFRSEHLINLSNLNFLFLNENPLDKQSWICYKKRFRFP
ncbi:MAG: leucine-rich repeat domain-containing protein [Promethearchaeota archaeon]|jgi:Leucine-rich repeat (LRR) protein